MTRFNNEQLDHSSRLIVDEDEDQNDFYPIQRPAQTYLLQRKMGAQRKEGRRPSALAPSLQKIAKRLRKRQYPITANRNREQKVSLFNRNLSKFSPIMIPIIFC